MVVDRGPGSVYQFTHGPHDNALLGPYCELGLSRLWDAAGHEKTASCEQKTAVDVEITTSTNINFEATQSDLEISWLEKSSWNSIITGKIFKHIMKSRYFQQKIFVLVAPGMMLHWKGPRSLMNGCPPHRRGQSLKWGQPMMDDDGEWPFWKILWKWMIIIQDDTGKNAFDINICWATQLFQMKSNEQQLRHPSMNACDVWKSLMLYTRNWVLYLLEEAKKTQRFLISWIMVLFNMFQSNSQILGKTNVSTCFNMFSQCFNHILKSVGKVQSFSGFFLRSSTADSSFDSPGRYNHGTTSWPPVGKPSVFPSKNSMGRLRIHGFLFGGKWWWTQKKWGFPSINDVPKNGWFIFGKIR